LNSAADGLQFAMNGFSSRRAGCQVGNPATGDNAWHVRGELSRIPKSTGFRVPFVLISADLCVSQLQQKDTRVRNNRVDRINRSA